MSIHRVMLSALAIFCGAVVSSAAFAGCCGGCGGCAAPSAAVVFAQPVAPLPPPPPVPVLTSPWTGCGCRQPVVYLPPPVVQPIPVAPAPIYVVNQGPDYTGPGIMVPFRTWSPYANSVWPGGYPYRPGFGYGYGYGHPGYLGPRPRIAYRARFVAHGPYRWPARRHWYH